jgi:uncharacterized protein YndB with AHSA1/START domain
MANDEPLTLRLERRILAPRERVFDAWTRPELLKHWSAPEGLTVEEGEQDVRAGGSWRVVMVEPDGARHEAFGTYTEVSPPDRLVYTHAWKHEGASTAETVLTLEFFDDGDGDATRLVLTQTGFTSTGSRDGHGEGWSSSLNQLERFFAVGA